MLRHVHRSTYAAVCCLTVTSARPIKPSLLPLLWYPFKSSLKRIPQRSFSSPPSPALVQAVRELGKFVRKAEEETAVSDHVRDSSFITLDSTPPLKIVELLKEDSEEKGIEYHTRGIRGIRKEFAQAYQELDAILREDAKRKVPRWSTQERQACKRWMIDEYVIRVNAVWISDTLVQYTVLALASCGAYELLFRP